MCQWKFLVLRYSAKVSARSVSRAPPTSFIAFSPRTVGVPPAAALDKCALLSFIIILLLPMIVQPVCIRLSRGAGRSEHGVVVLGLDRNRLQHVPVLDDFAVVIEAEDVDAGRFLPKEAQVTHVDKGQVAVDRDALDLVGHPSGLFEECHDALDAIGHQRIVLDVAPGYEVWVQVRPTLCEDLVVDGVDHLLHVLSVHRSAFPCWECSYTARGVRQPPPRALKTAIWSWAK